MFKKLSLLPLLFITFTLFAQKSDTTLNAGADTTIYTQVDTEAVFPGGQKGWINFIQHNLNAGVPTDNGAKVGKYIIWVKFIVTSDGHIKNIVAETKKGFGMEAEVIRMMSVSPNWVPAKKNGKPVNSYKRVSQTFEISEG